MHGARRGREPGARRRREAGGGPGPRGASCPRLPPPAPAPRPDSGAALSPGAAPWRPRPQSIPVPAAWSTPFSPGPRPRATPPGHAPGHAPRSGVAAGRYSGSPKLPATSLVPGHHMECLPHACLLSFLFLLVLVLFLFCFWAPVCLPPQLRVSLSQSLRLLYSDPVNSAPCLSRVTPSPSSVFLSLFFLSVPAALPLYLFLSLPLKTSISPQPTYPFWPARPGTSGPWDPMVCSQNCPVKGVHKQQASRTS